MILHQDAMGLLGQALMLPDGKAARVLEQDSNHNHSCQVWRSQEPRLVPRKRSSTLGVVELQNRRHQAFPAVTMMA